ncbi:HAD family phosphatase [Candidatus Woesearchaeota archaeon]|nr:MAG: HAD family phosphatase [Candidatus Woesearchaeota archaeon]
MRAVIFDMDGTLIDSEKYWKAVAEWFFNEVARAVPSDLERFVGASTNDQIEHLKEEGLLKVTPERFIEAKEEAEHRIYHEQTALMPGARDLLAALYAKGVPLALASSTARKWIEVVIDRFALRKYFTFVISGQDVPHGKPAPDIFLACARALGVAPKDCVVVEDSTSGVMAAKAAGMYCVGFKNGLGRHQDVSQADLIITRLAEVRFPFDF